MRKRKGGFTLVEIMVVVVVLAILAAAIIPNLTGRADEAKVSRAKADIASLETLLETFRLDMGRYPTTEEGLIVLREPPQTEDVTRWKGPYLRKPVSLDPWGNPYNYVCPGTVNIDSYDLFSYGADGAEGGEGYDQDVTNFGEEAAATLAP